MKLWAVLVGIEKYPVSPVDGAIADVNAVYEYLVRERGVRPECIQVLRDEEATRASILDVLYRHLLENPEIQSQDAILFHFSGHGTRVSISDEDLQEQKYIRSEDGEKIECLVPFDSMGETDEDSNVEPPIPDYSLGALLHKIAERHGNNITCVLDNCHSGSGTRLGRTTRAPTEWTKRHVEERYVGRLSRHTDRALWEVESRGLSIGGVMRRGALRGREDTHVLMAACEWGQSASGNSQGGVFTRHWLAALREGDGLSYLQIHKLVQVKMDAFYSNIPEQHRPDRQDPQVEGVGSDRPVFEPSEGDHRRRFAVTPGSSPTQCIIYAGELDGVKPGSVFQLQGVGRNIAGNMDATLLGTAVITEVQMTQCTAEISPGLDLTQGVRALLTQLAKPLQVVIDGDDPSVNALELELRSALNKAQEGTWFELAVNPDSADIVFLVGSEHITLVRKTPRLAELDIADPQVIAADVRRVFPKAMEYIARFNFYLELLSKQGSLVGDVDFALYSVFPRIDDEDIPDVDAQVPIENNEVIVTDQASYCLRLHNRGSHALCAYVLLFDPATYSINTYYNNDGQAQPRLRPGETLQLGASSDWNNDIQFKVTGEGCRDIAFFKVILSTEPINVTFMQQLDLADDPEPLFRSGSSIDNEVDKPVMKGTWDVHTFKMTVLR